MNLNKTFGRVATTLVAGAMLTALAMPAYAQEGEFSGNTITINKVLEMPADVNVPDVDFTFSIKTPDGAVNESYIDNKGTDDTSDDVTLAVKAGTASQQNAGTAPISPDAATTPKGENKTVTVPVTLTLPNDTYSEAGVYKYIIDEVDPTLEGVTDKTGSLNLYLIVTRKNNGPIGENEEFQVSGAVIKSADGSSKTATWTNYYKLDDSGESLVGSISVKKEIAGAMGNKNDTFVFTIDGLKDGVSYTYTTNDAPQVKKTMTKTNNTVTLGHNQTMTLVGLDDGSKITVTETIPANSGYETTNITNDNNADKTDGVVLTVAKNEVKDTTFTNPRNAVSPTGIVMNVAPYVLLVVVAAAGCFVFLRKRRED